MEYIYSQYVIRQKKQEVHKSEHTRDTERGAL